MGSMTSSKEICQGRIGKPHQLGFNWSSRDAGARQLPLRWEVRKESPGTERKEVIGDIENVTVGLAYLHREVYSSLGATIRESNLHLSPSKALPKLLETGFKVKVFRVSDKTHRYFILRRDQEEMGTFLRLTFLKQKKGRELPSIEEVSRGIAEAHRETFASLTEAIKGAGVHVNAGKVALILKAAGIRFRRIEVEDHSPSRGIHTRFNKYFILRSDLPQIIEFLRSSRLELRPKSS